VANSMPLSREIRVNINVYRWIAARAQRALTTAGTNHGLHYTVWRYPLLLIRG